MDWSVILDGFVLLMGWIGGGFLLYGIALVVNHHLPELPPEGQAHGLSEADTKRMRITVD